MTADISATPSPGPADASTLAAARRKTALYRFRYDVFISFSLGPPPRGAQSYASDLARRLRELDFSVFFSEEELVGGSSLTPSLRRGLERSKVLAVILNKAVLQDPRWIRDEVQWFRAKSPNGFICPVSIDGALSDPALRSYVVDLLGEEPALWVDETSQAWHDGVVSPTAFAKLVATPLRARANQVWRRITRMVMAVLVLATGIAVWQTYVARAELRRAIASRLTIEAADILASARDGTDEKALQMLLAAWQLDATSPALAGMAAAMETRRGLLKLRDAAAAPSSTHSAGSEERVVLLADGGITMFNAASLEPTGTTLKPKGSKIEQYDSNADRSKHAAVGSDGSVTIWDERARTPPMQLPGISAGGIAFGVLFNALGDRIMVLDSLKGARLFNGASGKEVAELEPCHSTSPMVVAHDARLGRFATGGPDRMVCVWDSATGRQLDAWKQDAWVRSLAFSPDGKVLAVGRGDIFHEDAALDLLDAASGKSLGFQLGRGEQSPLGIRWCPDGKCLVVQDFSNAYRVFRAPFHEPPLVFKDRVDSDQVSAISADGRTVAYSRRDGSVQLWDVQRGAESGEPLRGHKGGVHLIRFTADGQRLIVFGNDGLLRLWSINAPGLPEAEVLFDAGVATTSLAVAPGATAIAAGFENQSIALWAGGAAPRVLRHTGKVIALRFSTDGNLLAAAGEAFFSKDGSAALWSDAGAVGIWRADTQDAAPALEIEPEMGRLLDVAWRDKGTLVILGEKGLSLHDSSSGGAKVKPVAPLSDDAPRYSAARISPDGRLAAAVLQESAAVAILDTSAGKEVTVMKPAYDGKTLALAWMPDSTRLVTAGANGTIELWSARDGSRDRVLFVANGSVSDLAVSGDGQWVTAALGNGTIQLLNLDARVQVSVGVEIGYGAVARLAVGQNTKHIYSGNYSGIVRRLAGPDRWAELLCARLSANMSRKAWKEHVSPSIGYVAQCPGLPVPVD